MNARKKMHSLVIEREMSEEKTDADVKVIAFRGSEQYRRWLQQAALDRGLKVQGLLEDAVAAYVNGTAGEVGDSESEFERQTVGAFRMFLRKQHNPTEKHILDLVLRVIGVSSEHGQERDGKRINGL